MKIIDLHTHSVCSDGSMEPAEVVRAAKEAGLSAIALSDHDTTAGVAEAVAEGRRIGVEVVPAIELSSASETETHVLGYYIDPESPALREKLDYIRKARERREREICDRLTGLGLPVSFEEAAALAGRNIVCRIHIARVMIARGYVSSVREAFDKYLSSGRLAHSETQALTDAEAVRLIKDAGGLAFVAHLNQTRRSMDSLREFLTRLRGEGLDGVEGYYTEYTPESGAAYRALAAELGLMLSGGSDFHGANKDIKLGALYVPYDVLSAMKEKLSV